jgi:hypothetical protein
MADIFREIEQGYEAKYKLDEELHFKVRCRRNRLFGLWAAERLGLSEREAEEYARALVRLDLEQPGHLDVEDKAADDLRTMGQAVTERELFSVLARCETEAMRQITDAYPMPLDRDHVQVGG